VYGLADEGRTMNEPSAASTATAFIGSHIGVHASIPLRGQPRRDAGIVTRSECPLLALSGHSDRAPK
jgi:hypothetical protein